MATKRRTVPLQYGAIEIVGYEGPWRLEIYRPYTVPKNEPWNATIRERSMATGANDDTPRHDMSDYNPECSCCWLNITHTDALHVARTKKA